MRHRRILLPGDRASLLCSCEVRTVHGRIGEGAPPEQAKPDRRIIVVVRIQVAFRSTRHREIEVVVVRVDGEVNRPAFIHRKEQLALLPRVDRRRDRRMPALIKESKCLIVVDTTSLHHTAGVYAIRNQANGLAARRESRPHGNQHGLLPHLRHGQLRMPSCSVEHDVVISHRCCFWY
jgi:hypothetical protein